MPYRIYLDCWQTTNNLLPRDWVLSLKNRKCGPYLFLILKSCFLKCCCVILAIPHFNPYISVSGLFADIPDTFSSALPPEPQDNDEALALQLQQELDREAAQAQIVDLEDGGLFFCQICHRDLTHMTAEGRTQHLNRSEDFDCILDDSFTY